MISSRVISRSLCFAATIGTGTLALEPVIAQPIVPANDGTGTLVTPVQQGTDASKARFDIDGGQFSSDGTNLFHSFERFGLNAGQTANFLSSPEIRNILTRVVGGEVSVINGLIQVTGGSSNLFLLNPAGIVFGPEASLNVPASFFATTANQVGFNGGGWFDGVGSNNYQDLIGRPNSFVFNMLDPGLVLNAGDLAVGQGQTLSLIGGTVYNIGSLSAPGGQISLAGVPGQSMVRLSQEGMVLRLEIAPPATGELGITPVQLPQLLTEGNLDSGNATEVTVNPDGTVVLSGSGLNIPSEPGTTLVSGQLSVASSPAATSGAQIGGMVQILGEKVGLISATIDASGLHGGGSVMIGGDFEGKGTVPNANRTFVSGDSIIDAGATEQGDGGGVIVWADEVTGFYGTIDAQGGRNTGNGGFVEVSGKENLVFDGTVDVSAPNGAWGTLLLDPVNISISKGKGSPNTDISDRLPTILSDEYEMEDVSIGAQSLENQNANIVIEATNNITIEDGVSLKFVPGGSITFRADAGIPDGNGSFSMGAGQSITAPGRNITISAASIVVGKIDTSGNKEDAGAIALSATNGDITTGDLIASSQSGRAGDITLMVTGTEGNFSINSGTIDASSRLADGGNVNLQVSAPGGTINISNPGKVDTSSRDGNGGTIALTTQEGNINANNLNSSAGGTGSGGDITVTVEEGSGAIDISNPGKVDTSSRDGNGGTIALTTQEGNINVRNLSSNSRGAGTGGNITVTVEEGSGAIDIGNPGKVDTSSATSQGGNITLMTRGGNINVRDLSSLSEGGIGGNINIDGNTALVTLDKVNTFNLTVRADGIDFNGGANSISGTGSLVLQPGTASHNITIGGAASSTGSLDIHNTDLTAIDEGFSAIAIGRPDGTGTITLNEDASFNAPVTIQGGSTLVGPNRNTTWILNGENTGTLSNYPNGLTFNNIENLTGGNAADVFKFTPGSQISGSVDGGEAINTLDYSGYTDGNVTVKLGATTPGTATGIGGTILNIDRAIGNSEFNNTLIGENKDNTWVITDSNSGSINGNPFSNFSNLRGGDNNDTFSFNGGSVASIDGGAGSNTLQAGNTNNTWNIRGRNRGNLNEESSFSNIGNIRGGNQRDQFNLNGGSVSNVDGGAGSNTLQADNTTNTWKITGADRGNLNNAIAFTNIGNLTGGNLNDTFIFSDGATVSGVIDGALGIDTLDYSAYTTTVTVNLPSNAATGIAQVRGIENVSLPTSPPPPSETSEPSGNSEQPSGGSEPAGSSNGSETSTPSRGSDASGEPTSSPPTPTEPSDPGSGSSEDPTTTPGQPSESPGSNSPEPAPPENQAPTENPVPPGNQAPTENPVPTGNQAPTENPVPTGNQAPTENPVPTGNQAPTENPVPPGNQAPTENPVPTGKQAPTASPAPIVNSSPRTVDTGTSFPVDPQPTLENPAASTQVPPIRLDTSTTATPNAQPKLDSVGISTGNSVGAVTTDSRGNSAAALAPAQTPLSAPTQRASVSISAPPEILSSTESVVREPGSGINRTPGVESAAGANQTLTLDSTAAPDRIVVLEPPLGPDTAPKLETATTGATGIAIASESAAAIQPQTALSNTVDSKSPTSISNNPNSRSSTSVVNTPSSERVNLFSNKPEDALSNSNPLNRPTLRLTSRTEVEGLLDRGNIPRAVEAIDLFYSEEFENYFGQKWVGPSELSFAAQQNRLRQMAAITGTKPVVIYVWARAKQLDLIVVPPVGQPIYKSVPEADRAALLQQVKELHKEIGNPAKRRTTSYLASSQQLYNWIIGSLEADLQNLQVDTLLLSLDSGLRILPIAALHDGQQFLVEKYNLSLIPSQSLTDTGYRNLKNSAVLAMGMSQFDEQDDLPAVPVEIETIAKRLWAGEAFLNQSFTLDNLQRQREKHPFDIIHIATHAQFNSGEADTSYIQLWDNKLYLSRMEQMKWDDPPLELLVLSACRTALGDQDGQFGAEFGFAGIAVSTGAKSALASLWYANDAATLGLMSEFYSQLHVVKTKAEALRQAQIAIIQGKVRLENGQLMGSFGQVALPPEMGDLGNMDLRHPYYWAAFTMIGSPW